MLQRKIIFSLYFLLAVTLIPFSVFATWDGNPYSQGSTLDPECAPTDENCTVSLPEAGVSSQWISEGNNISFTDGLVGVGSISNNAKLNIDASTGGGSISLSPIGLNDNLGYTRDVVIKDNYAYVIANNTSVNIINISDPTNLTDVTTFSPDYGNLRRLTISGNYLFIAENVYVEIVDISDPTNPVHVTTWSANDSVYDIAVDGDYMYTAERSQGFEVVDISTIDNPTTILTNNSDGVYPQSAIVSGDYLYLNSEDSLFVYNITDKNNIVSLGYTAIDGYISGRMAISGNYLYTTNDTNDAEQSLVVFNISDPSDVSIASYGNIGQYRYNGSVAISGNYAYVADGEVDSLYIFDISNPNAISEVTHYSNDDGRTEGVAFSGDTIFIAGGNNGLVALAIDDSGVPALALKTSGGDILISGTDDNDNRYLNFGDSVGFIGYGFRNNDGIMQYKNAYGTWTDISGGDSLWNINDQGIDYTDDNVGIGISYPEARLDVLGTIRVQNEGDSYLNFNYGVGEEGTGLRIHGDNMQFKNYGGDWTDIGSGGGESFWQGDEGGGISFQDGNVGIGTSNVQNAALTIYQGDESSPEEQISNGEFNELSSWVLGDGWSYGEGDISFSSANPTGTIQSLDDVTIIEGGDGYHIFDHVGLDGGSDAEIEVLAVAGTPNDFSILDGGSDYQVNDVLTVVNNNGDSGTVQVDSVDGGGSITAISNISLGTNYYTDVQYNLSGGNGSGAVVVTDSFAGAIRSFNTLVDGGTGYATTSYNVTGGNGSGAVVAIQISSIGVLSQNGVLVNGDTYDVSLTVGGDTGIVQVCLDNGECQIFNAGDGNVSASLVWYNDSDRKIIITPSSDFNGSIDNVSVYSRLNKTPGLKIIDSNDTSVSMGIDYGEIAPAAGIKFTMDIDDGSQIESATLFLSGDGGDAHYGYALPSLGEPHATDTFCMQNLGNCSSSGVQSLSTAERDDLGSPTENQIIFNTTTKTMQYYTASNEGYTDGTGGHGNWAAYDGVVMGETIVPQYTGVLNTIQAQVTLNAGENGAVVAKIYDDVNGNLLATSDNTVNAYPTWDWSLGTWTFTDANLTLTADTTYYIEFNEVSGSRIFMAQTSGEVYSRGIAYHGNAVGEATSLEDYDLDFTLTYGQTDASWTDVSTGVTPTWNSNNTGIDYHAGNVGIGTTTPTAGIDVVGGGAGIGFSEIANYSTQTWSYDVVVVGDYAYAADGNRFDILDVSDPENGEIISGYDFGTQVSVVRVSGDYAYVAVEDTIRTFDISDPTDPQLVNTFEGWGYIRDMQILDGTLYVIDDSYNFYILDISDDHSYTPLLLTDGPYETYNYPDRLAVSGNRVYISDDDNLLEIWDVSDSVNPENLANYSYPDSWDCFCGGVVARGNYVYITRDTDDGAGFVVLDVSDPEDVQVLGSVDIGEWRYETRIILSGNIAYVADGNYDSIYAINISYPANPIIVGYGETEGYSYGVAVHGNDLIVADGDTGLIALHAPLNYTALFNGGNVGIGTNDPAFNLDVGAVKATATLTMTSATDGDGFTLFNNANDDRNYEFDADNFSTSDYSISIVDDESNPLTLSQIINNTVSAINNDGLFSARRDGNDIIIEQLIAGVSGNKWNYVWSPDDNQYTHHPEHPSNNFTLTDFTGGQNGDINFGGNLYQHGELFTGSQWTDTEGGITYAGLVAMDGNVSIGEGSFYYDNETGITSIDNLSLGALTFPEDAGAVSWIDMPISGNATNGTIESYTASIGGIEIMTVHGEMDEGDLINTGIRLNNLPTGTGEQTSFLCIDSTNEVIVGSGSDCDVSSQRFKENINTLTDDAGLVELMKLNPVSFFYKPEFNGALQANPNYSSEQVGFIAEEVQQVDPRLITLEADGVTPHGVRYEKITAILVKAVKEIGATLAGFADNFLSKKVTTDKLCVGTVCVTQAEFLHMIESSGTTPVLSEDSSPVVVPEVVSPTESVSEDIAPDSNTEADSVPSEPAPEVVPPTEPTPVPEQNPTPTPDVAIE